MATVYNGSSVTIQTSGQGSYQVVSPHNTSFNVQFVPANSEQVASTSGTGRNYGPMATTKTLGPYGIPGAIIITVTSGVSVTYTSVLPETVSLSQVRNPQKGERFRTILVGDSHLANQFTNTISSINVSGGIVTVVYVSAHQTYAGNYVSINNSYTAKGTTPLNGVNLPILTTPNSTTITFSATANGLTLPNGAYIAAQWNVNLLNANNMYTAPSWVNALIGNKFDVIGSYAVGGTTSDHAVQFFQNAYTCNPPIPHEVVWISVGTNDFNGVTTSVQADAAIETVMANIITIRDAAIAQGKICIIHTIPPLGTPMTNLAIKNAAIFNTRRRILDLEKNSSLTFVIDVCGAIADGTSVTGEPIAGTLLDGAHLTPSGIYRAVKFAIAQHGKDSIFQRQIKQSISILEDTSLQTQASATRNIIINGLMSGSSAAAGGNLGTTSTGWAAQTSASTVTFTAQQARVIPLSGIDVSKHGYALGVSQVASAINQVSSILSPRFDANLVAGNWYQFSLQVTNNGGSTLTALQSVQMSLFGDTSPIWFRTLNNALDNIPLLPNESITVSSPPMFFPTAVATLYCYPQITSSGSGTNTLQIASLTCESVPNPYN